MKRTLSIVCAITVLSSNLCTAAADPCDQDDASCLRLKLLDAHDELASLGKILGLKDHQIRLLQEGQDLILGQRNLAQSALQSMTQAASQLKPHWYEHPILWLGIGVVLGIGLTVLAGWAIGQAALRLQL
jgi:hypothetical protein